jgi:hypothetical protein
MSGWNTVHVRFNDARSGQAIPVRASFHASGQFLAPLGCITDFPVKSGIDVGGHVEIGPDRYHYIDGACEIKLPPGEVAIDVSHGFEYQPVRHVVKIAPGQISLRLSLARWIDLQPLGWYGGDTRVLDISPHTALLEAACEDVAVVNLLARDRNGLPPSNLPAFSGQDIALQKPGHLLAVNTFNVNPLLGSLALLHCHRPVFPLRAGDPIFDDWTLADWCDQCHRKKTGLVVWADPQTPNTPPTPRERLRSEALAEALLERIDAFEVVGFDDPEPAVLADWYQLLDAGLRLPLVGGSAKEDGGRAIGRVRTYACLGPGASLDYSAWIEAVRAGRTFVSSGPIVMLTVSGLGPGGVIDVEPGQRLVLRGEARSVVSFEKLELLVNGSVVLTKEAAGSRMAAAIETEWEAEQSAWVTARCTSKERLADGQVIFAQTSPVYVNVRGRSFRPERTVIQSLLQEIEGQLDWSLQRMPCAESARCERLAEVLRVARDVLLRRMRDDAQETAKG